MIKIEEDAYFVDELSEEIRGIVLSEYRYINLIEDWFTHITDIFGRDLLAKIGVAAIVSFDLGGIGADRNVFFSDMRILDRKKYDKATKKNKDLVFKIIKDKIYKELESEFRQITSDNAVIDYLNDQVYQFTRDGHLIDM